MAIFHLLNIYTMRVLIISDNQCETTHLLIRKLSNRKINFYRINDNDVYKISNIKLNSEIICNYDLQVNSIHGEFTVSFQEITSVWYRRGKINLCVEESQNDINPNYREFKDKIKNTLINFIYLSFKQKHYINTFYDDRNINKPYVLIVACKLGLPIPKSLISNRKEDIENYYSNDNLITKTLENAIIYSYPTNTDTFHSFTTKVDLNIVPEQFFPSFIQEQIIKRFEVRTFYQDGTFFSSAIFSQSNNKTIVDFRNYDDDHLNRVVPYSLPYEYESKLKELFRTLDYNSGSIDPRIPILDPNINIWYYNEHFNYYIDKQS